MITYVRKDIFESPAQVLVNTVNTVGVMGKGIAKTFKTMYPDMFKQYQILCEDNQLTVGKLWIFKTEHKWILNFPTKTHWRSPSKLAYIEEGLKKFVQTYESKGITSISFPLLGCGNGGLDWETEVQPIMEKYLRPLPIEIFIHLYEKKNTKPEHKNTENMKKWFRSMPKYLSYKVVWDEIIGEVNNNSYIFHNGRYWEVTTYNLDKKNELEQIDDEIKNTPMIVFSDRENQYTLTKVQFISLWRHIRTVGFCLPYDLPDGLDQFGSLIFSLFIKLNYIEPVELSHSLKNNQDLKTGIRLVPYKATDYYFSGEVTDDGVEMGSRRL